MSTATNPLITTKIWKIFCSFYIFKIFYKGGRKWVWSLKIQKFRSTSWIFLKESKFFGMQIHALRKMRLKSFWVSCLFGFCKVFRTIFYNLGAFQGFWLQELQSLQFLLFLRFLKQKKSIFSVKFTGKRVFGKSWKRSKLKGS